MFYQRKINRAMKWNKEQSMRADGVDPEEEELQQELRKHSRKEDQLPTAEELREEALEKVELEKGDLRSMIISAFITIVPVCIAVLLFLALFALLLFGGFA